MKIVIVSGALANKYRNGGGTWERLSWVTGLRRLGFDVYFVEQIAPTACVDATGLTTDFVHSVNLDWFRSVTRWFGVAERSALVLGEGEKCAGVGWRRLLEVAESWRSGGAFGPERAAIDDSKQAKMIALTGR